MQFAFKWGLKHEDNPAVANHLSFIPEIDTWTKVTASRKKLGFEFDLSLAVWHQGFNYKVIFWIRR